jgi:transporter family-2 protein
MFGLAVLAGAVVPLQVSANAALGRSLGHPLWATLVSLLVSVVVIVPLLLAGRVPAPGFGEALRGPWWIWMGGVAGALYVTAALTLAPRLGAAGFIVAVIAGQMVISMLIDHFGLMGFAHKPVSLARLLGVGLILIGMVVTQAATVATTPAVSGR